MLRKRLLKELIRIIAALNLTTIFVTHDHEEAYAADNSIVVMNQGEIVQLGTPQEIVKAETKNCKVHDPADRQHV